MAYFLNPLLANNLQKKQDVFKGSFFIKLEDGSELDAKELIESIEDITSELNQKLNVKLPKANAILITNNNGNITPVEGVVMQQAERDKLASLEDIEGSGTKSNKFGLGTQAVAPYQIVLGRYNLPDNEGKYALIVGNGTSDNERSNAFAVTWDGAIESENLGDLMKNFGGILGAKEIHDSADATENGILYILTEE